MSRCRTRRSTSPTETSPSTSAPRSSPATTSRPRSPRRSVATSTSRRASERASTRSSSGSGPARAARSASSASSSASGSTRRTSRVETFRVYRGRTGKFVLHVERSADYTMVDAEGKPAGWRGYLGIGNVSYGITPAESTLEVVESLDELRDRDPAAALRHGRRLGPAAGRRGPRHLSLGPRAVGRGGAAMTATGARPAIRATGLRKSYGKQVVLDGIDLEVAEGTVFALLGPNGAGKTTTVHILSTLIAADGGEVQVAGHDVAREPDAVRAVIGLTGQFSAVDGLFTGEENLRLMADLRHLGKREGRRRVAELLERFDLVDAAKKPVATYSGGMRRRLDLAMTLVGDPRIIFLDEPTAGLDPRSRRVMWQIDPRPRRRRRHDLPDDAVPRGGGSARRPDRASSTTGGSSPRARPTSSSGSCRAATSGSRSRDAAELERAARTFDGASRDDEALTLQVPSDGGVALAAGPARPARRRLDRRRRAVRRDPRSRRRLPVAHRRPRAREGDRPMTALPARPDRLGDDAAAQPAPDAPLPVADPLHRRHPGRLPAAVRVRLRRHARGRPRRRGRRARRVHRVRRARDPADHRGRRRPGHGDLGRHGHDRGHHRPLPDDGHRPRRRS